MVFQNCAQNNSGGGSPNTPAGSDTFIDKLAGGWRGGCTANGAQSLRIDLEISGSEFAYVVRQFADDQCANPMSAIRTGNSLEISEENADHAGARVKLVAKTTGLEVTSGDQRDSLNESGHCGRSDWKIGEFYPTECGDWRSRRAFHKSSICRSMPPASSVSGSKVSAPSNSNVLDHEACNAGSG